MENNYYKLYQLASFFSLKYGYRRLIIKGIQTKDDVWIFNDKNPTYQIIHLTLKNLESSFGKDDISESLKQLLAKQFKVEKINILTVHVSKEEVTLADDKDTICVEENYYSGQDYSFVYPGIKEVVHYSSDPQKEMNELSSQMNKDLIKNRKKYFPNPFKEAWLTTLIFAICVALYIALWALQKKGYDTSAIYVYLGADYKTFTLGLGQFYRLLTYGFVHGSFAHCLCNMYSLTIIGPIIEKAYGKVKYLIIIFGSIICGGLCQGILTSNSLCMGLSAGLYGIMTVYILMVVEHFDGHLPRNFIYVIFLNLIINFIPTVAWQAHLGGAIFGLVSFYMFKDNKLDYKFIVLAVLLIGALGFKYVSNNEINPLYAGTDKEILRITRQEVSENSYNKLKDKLVKLYIKEGAFYYE